MGVKEIYGTLHDFLVEWLTNSGFRDDYDGDLEWALEDHGFDDVDPQTLLECLPLVAEDLPLVHQQAIYEYMNTVSNVDSGSTFAVNQGGGAPSGAQGGGGNGGHHAAGAAAAESQHADEPIDEVIRHIYNIQNVTEQNYSYIDDSGDVTTTINSLGDVDLDQVVATGDGAVAAGGDVEGVSTGINNGIVAGDDVEDAEVTNVAGDRNVTGELGDATVVTGDDNVLAKDSTVIDGDFDGQFVGGDIDADDSALNFGDGQVALDDSVDNSVRIKDSFNTDNSIEDSFKIKDSLNDQSDHSKHLKIKDSLNDQSDHSKHLKIEDSGNTDSSTNLDLEVEDSFQDNSDHSVDTDLDVDIEDSFTHDEDNDTITKSYEETDLDVEIDVSEDGGGHHAHHG